MDRSSTYKIFAIKTLKEKRYYWARNTFFVLFPLLFFVIYICSGASNTPSHPQNEAARTISEASPTSIAHEILITFSISVLGRALREHTVSARRQNLLRA